jgi:hypothetical protein
VITIDKGVRIAVCGIDQATGAITALRADHPTSPTRVGIHVQPDSGGAEIIVPCDFTAGAIVPDEGWVITQEANT